MTSLRSMCAAAALVALGIAPPLVFAVTTGEDAPGVHATMQSSEITQFSEIKLALGDLGHIRGKSQESNYPYVRYVPRCGGWGSC